MIFNGHGYVPFKYKKQWERFQKLEGGKLWREQKKVVKRLKEVARISALRIIGAKNEKNISNSPADTR